MRANTEESTTAKGLKYIAQQIELDSRGAFSCKVAESELIVNAGSKSVSLSAVLIGYDGTIAEFNLENVGSGESSDLVILADVYINDEGRVDFSENDKHPMRMLKDFFKNQK
jgi:hypothetical protein